MIAVFSSILAGTFVIERLIPATAVIIAEPPNLITPRHSESHSRQLCPRPIIDVIGKLNNTQIKFLPILSGFSKITTPFSNLQSKLSELKSKLFQELGLACLFPRLLRPFEPIFAYAKCKLGVNDDGFMQTPPCNAADCRNNARIEDKIITRDRGLPNLDFMVDGAVREIADCFPDMARVRYGSRVLVKIVDDQPCEDPRYKSICDEAMDMNQIVLEENCQSAG